MRASQGHNCEHPLRMLGKIHQKGAGLESAGTVSQKRVRPRRKHIAFPLPFDPVGFCLLNEAGQIGHDAF